MKLTKILKPLYIDKNTLYSISSKIIAMICFLLTDILLARLLTMQQYGEWAYFFSVVNIVFHISYFGLNAATKVHIAQSINDASLISRYIKAAIILRLLCSIVICLVFFIALPYITARLGYPIDFPNLRYLLLAGVLMVLFNSVNEFFKEVWVGFRKLKNLFFQMITEHSLVLLIGISLVFITGSNISMTFGYIGAYVASIILTLVLLKSYFSKKGLSLKRTNSIMSQAKKILLSAPPLLLFSISTVVLAEIDIAMLGIMGTYDQVATYSVAKRICSRIVHFNLAYIMALMPKFAIINEKNKSQQKKEFWSIMKVNVLIAIGIAIALLAFSQILIPFLYGADFTQSVNFVYALLPYYIISAVTTPLSAILEFQKKFLWRNVFFIAANILGILLNITLIPILGAMGAALSVTIISLVYLLALVVLVFGIFRTQKTTTL